MLPGAAELCDKTVLVNYIPALHVNKRVAVHHSWLLAGIDGADGEQRTSGLNNLAEYDLGLVVTGLYGGNLHGIQPPFVHYVKLIGAKFVRVGAQSVPPGPRLR